MAQELSWKFPVVVAELPAEGTDFEIVPSATDRAALAAYAGVEAIPELSAQINVRPEGNGGVVVAGALRATVTQTCVVTLEAFDNTIEEKISLRFEPPDALQQGAEQPAGPEDDDPPDPLEGEALDLAAVVAEFLVLAIDPYPRKPGAVFEFPEARGGEAEASPFAALAKLKGGGSDKKG